MQSKNKTFTDIRSLQFLGRNLPKKVIAYIHLLRIDRPVGIWLLLSPCLWAIGLADSQIIQGRLMLLFLMGAIIMRGAGCLYNDLVDRRLDAQVDRTKSRPLASGQISVKEGIGLMISLSLIGFLILIQLSELAILLGVASLGLVAIYPWMKRFTYWPQVFLGFAFNWGALMGWATVQNNLSLPTLLIFASGICWTLFYDTIYAHMDKDDDLLVGIKSTALLFNTKTKPFLSICAVGFGLGMGSLLYYLDYLSWPYLAGLMAAIAHMIWQIADVSLDNPKDCLAKFKSNQWVGILIFLGILANSFIQ